MADDPIRQVLVKAVAPIISMTGNPSWGGVIGAVADLPELPPGIGDTPTIVSLQPNTAEMGSPDLTMIVNGTGFNDKSVIVWNGSDEPTSYISATQVSTGVKPSTASGPYACTVAVRNLSGAITAQLPFTFTELTGALAIWEIVPPEGPTNDEDFHLEVYGQGFGTDSVITFNGSPKTTTFVTVSHLSARIKVRGPDEGPVPVLVGMPLLDSNIVNYTFTAPVAEVELEEVEEIEEDKPVKRKRRKKK